MRKTSIDVDTYEEVDEQFRLESQYEIIVPTHTHNTNKNDFSIDKKGREVVYAAATADDHTKVRDELSSRRSSTKAQKVQRAQQ